MLYPSRSSHLASDLHTSVSLKNSIFIHYYFHFKLQKYLFFQLISTFFIGENLMTILYKLFLFNQICDLQIFAVFESI
jgi:hypothetical protein